jgi:hypothetical protein
MHGMTINRVFIERGVFGLKRLSDRPEGASLLAPIKPSTQIKAEAASRSALIFLRAGSMGG